MITEKSKNVFSLLLISILFLFHSGCTKKIYDVSYPAMDDGRYDSEFPYRNASKQLEEISNSIKILNYIAYYKAYIFDENLEVTVTDISDKRIEDVALSEIYFNETSSGTATVFFYDGKKVGLLTCAHIGQYPDTSLTYFEPLPGQDKKYIKQVAIKVREHYYVNELPGGGEFKVVLSDTKRDLAILSKQVDYDTFLEIRPFKYPIGKSSKLELGSFVYIIGYPMGHKMITKGIVSNTRDNKSDSFLIDALFNRGFSGGIILAIRDGVPNFELVGMAKSVSAQNEYFLTPSSKIGVSEYDPNIVYTGDSRIKKFEGINYGITYTISTDEILKFFKENERTLIRNGLDFKHLYN